MKTSILKDHITSRLSDIEENLKLYKKNQKPELLHELRVNTKKIKAILNFLEHAYKPKNVPGIKPLEKIFKKAGKIRDLQLNIDLLKNLPKRPQILIRDLKENETQRSVKFHKKIGKYIKGIEQLFKEMDLPGKPVEEKHIKKYFKKQIEKVDSYYKGRKHKRNIHYLRMTLKNIMYLYKALPKKLKKHINLNAVYLNKLQEKAGQWHDLYSSVNFYHTLKSHSLSYIVTMEHKELKQFNSLIKVLQSFNKKIYNS